MPIYAHMSAVIPVFVKGLFDSFNRTDLLYHNYLHTCRVVYRTKEIADHSSLDKRSHFVLESAAWFHDTGQLTGDTNIHEQRSVQFMREFFAGKLIDDTIINDIAKCIMATKLPSAPTDPLQEIICDADTFHLGTKDFQELDQLVWKELELKLGQIIDNKAEKSLLFLRQHQFYSSYCQQVLSAGKQHNIEVLEKIIRNR